MSERTRRPLADHGVYVVRGETSDPRPDFIGGETWQEREDNRRELFTVLGEGIARITAYYAHQRKIAAENPTQE